MKIGPLGKTKFEDSAEFCPHCKAQLEDWKHVEQEEKKPVPKSVWIALLATFAVIGGFILLYKLVYSQFM